MGVRSAIVPLFVRDVLHESATWTGIGFLVVAALNAATLLPGGKVADTIGRRPVLVAGCLASGASMVMLAVLPGLWGFLLALGVLGLGSGLLDVAPAAMIGDLLGAGKGGGGKRGGRKLGGSGQGGTVVASFQMAGDIGTVSGHVAVGFLVDSVSYGAAFVRAAGVLGLAAVAGFVAPETRKADKAVPSEQLPSGEIAHERITAAPACVSGTPGGQRHTDPA
jgi:MFS family permease